MARYTFHLLKDESARSPNYEDVLKISEIEVDDEKTVTLHFNEPSATFFNAISNALSKATVTAGGDDYGRQTVGTSAYAPGDLTTGVKVFPTGGLLLNDAQLAN